jgi:hypothetical protein
LTTTQRLRLLMMSIIGRFSGVTFSSWGWGETEFTWYVFY